MDAGALDRKIIIQRASIEKNGYGEEIKTWATHLTCWATVLEPSGMERFRASRNLAVRMARFLIRYYDGLLSTDRISWDGEIWDITGFSEVVRGRVIEITAEVKK